MIEPDVGKQAEPDAEPEPFDEDAYQRQRKRTQRASREEQAALEERQFADGLRALAAIDDDEWDEAMRLSQDEEA